MMKEWVSDYLEEQRRVLASIAPEEIAALVSLLAKARREDRQIFVFGNGGSAASASHFATDLGKGASDVAGPFRVMSLNDNVSWMTALGNDYSYEDVFVRQLQNFANPGDLALCLSVSGNSPNCVKAMEWAQKKGLITVALVGGNRGRLAQIADHVVVIGSEHYGKVEDAHMGICHMLCYAFMEKAAS